MPRNKESTGPGTTRARPPKIKPIDPFRRQDNFASIEIPLFSRVNSFVRDSRADPDPGSHAGLALLYESPFAAGDFISTGGILGTVVSVRLFSVRIRTTDGVYVHIPNDQIYSTTVPADTTSKQG
ncbi:mechanosensitive ion channel domain-containing protein [Methanoregula sp.]|uniref:mechanosensitive ion channel domain-containing protein n=1 Tax=Methanoregula sp. TaxID=2052170 RepID=UPI00345571A8